MNVLDAVSGSFANPSAACWAATKALVALMVRLRSKSERARARGSSGGLRVAPAAIEFRQQGSADGMKTASTSMDDRVLEK